ncbi:MAG: CDP-diacylglycerol--serine O-phosphatidyltransferase [Chloroherpetonaceae bacterium]|nr:CDP-diacylglycerol--serine O-phosphatidyltransferase [Chloroherpetonaceae bacterium]
MRESEPNSKISRRNRFKPKRRFKMGQVKMPRVSRSAFPSTFTVMNMLCGYGSIICAEQREYALAGWFIVLAAVFDAFDGFVARLTNSSSDFGVELDSLSDLVSFGAAPSFLAYKFGLEHFGVWGAAISSALMVGSGLRLARFNVQLAGFSKEFFTGLPTPSQAMTLSSFVIWTSDDYVLTIEQTKIALVALTLALALLMVSVIKYDRLPSPKEFRERPFKTAAFALGFLAIALFQAKGFFFAMCVYIGFGILRHAYFFFSEEVSEHRAESESTEIAPSDQRSNNQNSNNQTNET